MSGSVFGGGVCRVLALGLFVGTLISSPLQAKKSSAGGPEIAMSDGFRTSVQAAQTALRAGDVATASGQVASLQPTNGFESYVAASLRFEVAAKRGDVQAERIALTDMFKTNAVPASQAPNLRYLAGLYSFYVGNYDDTVSQLEYARQLGNSSTNVLLLMSDAQVRKGKLKDARGLIVQAFAQQQATGKPISAAWYDRAIALAYKDNDWASVGALYRERLSLYPSTGNWRTAITNYRAAPGLDPQIQLDLFRLQAANGAMASQRDYLAYAILAAQNGYSAEAKAIVETGRSAGKLSANDPDIAKHMKVIAPKAKKEIADLPALVKKGAAASNGKIALEAANSYFSMGQYPQAATQYQLALSKGGIDGALANTRLGIALARSGDLTGAAIPLAQVNGDWKNVAGMWSIWTAQKAKQTAALAAQPDS